MDSKIQRKAKKNAYYASGEEVQLIFSCGLSFEKIRDAGGTRPYHTRAGSRLVGTRSIRVPVLLAPRTNDLVAHDAMARNPVRGFTQVELLVVVTVIAILGALFLPALARRNARSSRVGCDNNLKQIGVAFRTFALDSGEKFPMQLSATNGGTMELVPSGLVFPHFQVMSNELSSARILRCPNDIKRVCATNFTTDLTDSKISYFVAVDASEEYPQSLLSGDRNLTINSKPVKGLVQLTTNQPVSWGSDMHRGAGNIGLSDGSVQPGNSVWLQSALGSTTNRIVVP
jgi:competence protein ComGC